MVSEAEWALLGEDELNPTSLQKKKHEQWLSKIESKTPSMMMEKGKS